MTRFKKSLRLTPLSRNSKLATFYLLLATCFLLSTTHALAADSVFFEFAPDAWASSRFIVASVQEPLYQVFSVGQTVQLTGIDFWVDNIGESGNATLRLSDEQAEIFSKTISVPSLSALPGGRKLHVKLNSAVTLDPSATYSLQIESDLPGLAFYSADRILMLEHDKNVTNSFTFGAARIGQTLQPFTFKMALYSPQISGAGYLTQQSEIIEATTATTTQSNLPAQTIAITNARVVETTATSATLAWTTNIAADSRVSIRTQLNPLYVIKTATDPTWELEHTVVISGLIPNVNYFADVFSTQGDVVVLTTYTIGFKTQPGSVSAPSTPASPSSPSAPSSPTTSAASPTSPQPTTASNTANPATNNSSQSSSGSSSASSASLTNEIVATKTGSNQTTISWPKNSSEKTAGYRIDVFDANKNLERSMHVESSAESKNVPGLTSGTHHVVVYEKKTDGTFVKVSPEKEILVTKGSIMGKLAGGAGVLAIIFGLGAFSVWKFKKEKTILPAEEDYNPESY